MNKFDKLLVIVLQNKQIDYVRNTMSKHQNVKTHFSNTITTGNLREFKFERSLKIIFWWLYAPNSHIVTTSASDFKHLYIFYNFYPTKQTFWSEKIPYLTYIFNFSGQTQLLNTIFVCAMFHWKQKLKFFVNYQK